MLPIRASPGIRGLRKGLLLVLRWSCLTLAAGWAVAGAVAGVVLFQGWRQPPPPFNPVTDGPIPATNSGFDLLLQSAAMAFWLGWALVLVACLGLANLRGARLGRRWLAVWACAVMTAGVLEVAFIGAFFVIAPAYSGLTAWSADLVRVATLAVFAVAGVAMTAAIMTATVPAPYSTPS